MKSSTKPAMPPAEFDADLTEDEISALMADPDYRCKVDARLRAAEALGGGMPAEDFYRELNDRYAR